MTTPINNIETGDTFREWLASTNALVLEINNASSSGNANAIVRFDANGGFKSEELIANTIIALKKLTVPTQNNYILTGNTTGDVIFDTDSGSFMGYDGTTWGSLGGVIDLDQDTYVSVDKTIGTDLDEVYVVCASNTITTFSSNGVIISGDLVVSGTTTYINTTELEVKDAYITLNKGGDTLSAQGAGIEIEAANSYIKTLPGLDGFEFASNTNGVAFYNSDSITFNANTKTNVLSIDEEYVKIGANTGLVLLDANSTAAALEGTIRYNSTQNQFQGFSSGVWQGLGGVITPDQNTHIKAIESSSPLGDYIETTVDNIFVANTTSNGYSFHVGLTVPVGNTTNRITEQGSIRYNTDDSTFEGYDGTVWGSLGGVITPDKTTSIIAKDGLPNDHIETTVDSILVANTTSNGYSFYVGLNVPVGNTANRITANGSIRFNDEIGTYEGYDSINSVWGSLGGVITPSQNTFIKAIDTGTSEYITSNVENVHIFTIDNSNSTFHTNVIVEGDLTVNGSMTTISTTNVEIVDPLITLNKNGDATSANGSGFEFYSSNAAFYLSDINSTLDGYTFNSDANGIVFFNEDFITLKGNTQSLTIQEEGVIVEGTGYLRMPVGDDTNRPSTTEDGMIRFNANAISLYDGTNYTYCPAIEFSSNNVWYPIASYSNEYQRIVPSDGLHDFVFSSLPVQFEENTIVVYIDGIKIPRTDYTIDNFIPGESKITFDTPRIGGQVITIIHEPAYSFNTQSNTYSKADWQNGIPDDIITTGNTRFGIIGLDTVQVNNGLISNTCNLLYGSTGINGSLTVSDSITELSSAELKMDILPIENALDTVLKLTGVSYKWKDTEKEDIGLIAEDVAEIFPELVSYSNGKPIGVKYSKFVSLLLQAIKEQQKTIDTILSKLKG